LTTEAEGAHRCQLASVPLRERVGDIGQFQLAAAVGAGLAHQVDIPGQRLFGFGPFTVSFAAL
jgi:hypothetical protein